VPAVVEVGRHVIPLRTIYFLNPLSAVLDAFRWSLLGIGSPNWPWLGYSTAMTAALLFFGAVFFKRMERKFADVI
jgi:lipopolysaccharide transport system permease protein